MREEKERQREIDLKKKQNLEALNNVFKKRTEHFKKKKEVETVEKPDESIEMVGHHAKPSNGGRSTAMTSNQSQDNFKVSHFTANKLSTRHNTTKNSMTSSVAHSIQSPLSRKVYPSNNFSKKRASITEMNRNASKGSNLKSRKHQDSKSQKKSVKKVISIPSVKIDKQLAKAQKQDGNKQYYDVMDTIPENQDMSEVDAMSVVTKSNKKVTKENKKTKKSERGSTRKVVISKINKPTKNSAKKSDGTRVDKHKIKKSGKKVKSKRVKTSAEKINQSTNSNLYEQSLDNESYGDYSYQKEEFYHTGHFQPEKSSNYVRSSQNELRDSQIRGELEYHPQEKSSHRQSQNTENHSPRHSEWDNIEMFSSKKFRDIMSKHKQFSRYKETEENQDESYVDLNSNRRSNNAMQVQDIINDEQDVVSQKTNKYQQRKSNLVSEESPLPKNYDKIKKVETSAKREVQRSRELKFEDLSQSKRATSRNAMAQNDNLMDFTDSQKGTDRIFTTSINLMENDLLSRSRQSQHKHDFPNSKTQDYQRMDFIGSNQHIDMREAYDNKNLIIDDYEEFENDNREEQPTQQNISGYDDPDVTGDVNVDFEGDDENGSECINENAESDYPFQCHLSRQSDEEHSQPHENISVFEDEEPEQCDDFDKQNDSFVSIEQAEEQNDNSLDYQKSRDSSQDKIPFNIKDLEDKNDSFVTQEENDQATQEENGVDTLQHMRLLFGSEQKIREQSEAAIKNLNNDTHRSVEQDSIEEEEKFKTPGLSQSVHEEKHGTTSSNVFDKHSFQDFSMKKFQEIMFDNNISDFVSSVERTVRQNTARNKPCRVNYEEHIPQKSFTPKKESKFMSPRKFSRKEIELDSMVGFKMKHMSEKKRQRNSVLDKNENSLVKNTAQDPLNKSLDYYRAKYGKSVNDNQSEVRDNKESTPSANKRLPDLPFKVNNEINIPLQIERTDQALIKNKLQEAQTTESKIDEDQESIKRSSIRGLDNMLSETSQDLSKHEEETHSLKSFHESDETKTLKYGTDERQDHSESAKSKQSQKEQFYGELERIMGSCFPKESKANEEKQFDTLKYPKTEETPEKPQEAVISPLSSAVSSPQVHKSINKISPNKANIENSAKHSEAMIASEKTPGDEIITPRDINSNNQEQLSYRTPNSKMMSDEYLDLKSQREISKETLQASYEAGRREDAFNYQFYSNPVHSNSEKVKQLMNQSDLRDDNIHIYVDQWDNETSARKYDEISSSDAYNANESIGIHTARNSPLESNKKDYKEYTSSEKYTVTEESAEKSLDEVHKEKQSFEYLQNNFKQVKKNLENSLQENLENSMSSPDYKGFVLNNSNTSQELTESALMKGREHTELQNLPPSGYNMVSPRPDQLKSPEDYDESKCVVLSNKKCKSIDDSDHAVSIIDDSEEIYKQNDQNKRVDYVTDEILSMMFFSDIHDNPIFPYRSKQVIFEAQKKYPFNKPLGINTSKSGVEGFLDDLICHIEEYYVNDVIQNLERPITVDPVSCLAQLQFYEETDIYGPSQTSEDILSGEVFYSLEQLRKNMYDGTKDDHLITNEEKNNKIHNTFIHDKMLFDSFNAALAQLSKRKEEQCPWIRDPKKLTAKKYNEQRLFRLLHKTKLQVMKCNKIFDKAGTRKVPPPSATNSNQNNMDDIFAPPPPAPTDEERNQQIREEKLSTLLSNEINDEDKNWLQYNDCATQVKLDLADMILEDLAGEIAFLLPK